MGWALPQVAVKVAAASIRGWSVEEHNMSDVRITCITRSATNGGYEHITHVGSPQFARNWTVAEVIASIDAATNTFYVQASNGKRADVGVVREAGKRPYIRTYADGYYNDNLLALPACA
jgi:hypothetical protein